MRIFFHENDLEKSLGNAEKQLRTIDRTVKSLTDLASDLRKSDELDFRLGFLQLMVKKLFKLIEETRVILAFYLNRPDRAKRLLDNNDPAQTADLFAQLTASNDSLWPLGKSLEDTVARARAAKSASERIEYVDVLRVSVSGLKETFAGWTHVLRQVMIFCTDSPGLRFLKATINSLPYWVIIFIAVIFMPRNLVNLPEWFQEMIAIIVAIGIFIACVTGRPPKIAIIDLA